MLPMDTETIKLRLEQYPKLANFITAGTISLKASRTILGIDKDTMYDLYLELLQAGAIVGVGYNCFRASDTFKDWWSMQKEL